MALDLTPEKGLVFRIMHKANLPWTLANGLRCPRSPTRDPGFRPIGDAELISKRQGRPVPIENGGTLDDYVPFYLTPRSIMLYKILTGQGIPRQDKRDIVMLMSSVDRVRAAGTSTVIIDSHAVSFGARYSTDPAFLAEADWAILRACDFQRDANDPGKLLRYQAEVLARGHVPLSALVCVACCDDTVAREVEATVAAANVALRVVTRSNWFFA